MLHCDFDKKDSWHEDGYKYVKERQLKELKKQVPLFSENDWVLWIIPELYYEYTAKINGNIIIEKKDGKVLTVPFLQRTPYKNKRIFQLSMKKGNRRFFGFPLVFKSFEELSEVKKISIKWDIYHSIYLPNNYPLEASATNVLVNYNLDFKKDDLNPDYHFFTVHSKDYTYDSISTMPSNSNINLCDKYYKEFDKALSLQGFIEYFSNNDKHITTTDNVYDIKSPNDSLKITPQEQEIISLLENYNQNFNLLKEVLATVKIKKEIVWESFYYEKTETLTAAYMADF